MKPWPTMTSLQQQQQQQRRRQQTQQQHIDLFVIEGLSWPMGYAVSSTHKQE
jgi:hypothetical protein